MFSVTSGKLTEEGRSCSETTWKIKSSILNVESCTALKKSSDFNKKQVDHL